MADYGASQHWTEDDSARFLTLDDVAVPMREQQIATGKRLNQCILHTSFNASPVQAPR